MAEPQAWHRVEAATDDVEWYLNFTVSQKTISPKNTTPILSIQKY